MSGAIWCEPEFFYILALHLGISAKNSGWQIALISFVTFLHQGRKVSFKKKRLFEGRLNRIRFL